MTWNRGRIVNITPTIVPFQKESSKTSEGCSTMPRPVHPHYEIPILCFHRTTRYVDYRFLLQPVRTRRTGCNLGPRQLTQGYIFLVRVFFSTLLIFSEDFGKISDPYSIWIIGTTMPFYVMKWC